jgi:UDPglucose--hexose-1-phosphate uridylyltransferase
VRFALQRLNAVLEKPGYNILLHTAPLKRPLNDRFASAKHDYCWHLEIVPRFHSLAGFEIGLGAYINTVYPEDAARFLRGEVRA